VGRRSYASFHYQAAGWARIVRHGRYVVFQLAEVAVPRALFAETCGTICAKLGKLCNSGRPQQGRAMLHNILDYMNRNPGSS
jgi:hypothetical protein